MKCASAVIFGLLTCAAFCAAPENQVQSGLDVLVENDFAALAGKRVGLITNHTAVTADNRHAADLMAACSNVRLTVLFAPEHGVRGNSEAGATITDEKDPLTEIPAISLYGATRKPTAAMLKDVDVLVFDIQDVGARFYTYISTLFLTLEAAAEQGIPYVVLDRPNPIGGHLVEGPVLDAEFKSFVGIHELPVRHGMTVGELALLFNGEKWLRNGVRADLKIIKMANWKRDMLFDETGLPWVKPSPNMVSLQTALVYPGTCLIEGTNLSEGRGTLHPFEQIGAPWLNAGTIADELRGAPVTGVRIDTVSFVPQDLPGVATANKHDQKPCRGLFFSVTQPRAFQSLRFGLYLLAAIRKHHPDSLKLREASLNRLLSDAAILKNLQQGVAADSLWRMAEADLQSFLPLREKYLLY